MGAKSSTMLFAERPGGSHRAGHGGAPERHLRGAQLGGAWLRPLGEGSAGVGGAGVGVVAVGGDGLGRGTALLGCNQHIGYIYRLLYVVSSPPSVLKFLSIFILRGIDQATRMQSQCPQSAQSRKSVA